MKEKINLYWYKHNEGHGNFGDELNPYIIEKLTNLKVNHFDVNLFNLNKLLFIKTLTYSFLKRKISLSKFLLYIYYYFFEKPKVLIAIGSVLNGVNSKNYTVWGAGILTKEDSFKNADFRAVRGEFSQKRINELGFEAPTTIGDPAVLLPLIYKSNIKKSYKIGIIPHFKHFKSLEKYSSQDFRVINLLDPIEKIINEINSCEITFSTSLHGIIVSHVYSIPSLWCEFYETEKSKLAGDDIKFADYFSSVDIENYSPIHITNINIDLINLMTQYDKLILPSIQKVKELQQNLLKVAPFPILDKYRK